MKTLLLGLGLLALLPFSSLEAQQFHRWVDKDGVTHFTAEPPDPAQMAAPSKQAPTARAREIDARERYVQERELLEEQRASTINAQRRDQLDRQILVLDYNWYKDRDPAKAAAIQRQLGEAAEARGVEVDQVQPARAGFGVGRG